MTASKIRSFILIVDDGAVSDLLASPDIREELDKNQIDLSIVTAKDGAQALLKAEFQKFDIVIVDTLSSRVHDNAFASGISHLKNLQESRIYAVCEDINGPIPKILQTARTLLKPLDTAELVSMLIADICSSRKNIKMDGTKYSVDVRVINAIIGATLKVMSQFQLAEIKMGKPQMKNCADGISGEIASVLEIVSDGFRGQLCISFDRLSFLELVSSMLGEAQTEITPDNQDAVGEINNIIFGNAKPDLVQYGVSMSIPKIVQGSGNTVDSPAGSAMIQVPFHTKSGRFYIEVIAHPMKAATAA